ncbi:MAG: DUF5996 family protein [Nostocoides sp.]
MTKNASWPALAVDSWTDTRETLHMWLQIVGKIQLGRPLWSITGGMSLTR